jgi:hypothetical protein
LGVVSVWMNIAVSLGPPRVQGPHGRSNRFYKGLIGSFGPRGQPLCGAMEQF